MIPTPRLPLSTDVRIVRAPSDRAASPRLEALAVGVAPGASARGEPARSTRCRASAGVVCLAKPGDAVEEGQPVLELHLDDPVRLESALEALEGAITIGDEPPPPEPLVIDILRP